MERCIVSFAMLWLCAPLWAAGCVTLNEERATVRAMAVERLDCPDTWFGPHIDEADEAPVRHWSASCNHRSVRITCTHQGCSEEVQRPRLLCDMPLGKFSQQDGGSATAAQALSSDPSSH